MTVRGPKDRCPTLQLLGGFGLISGGRPADLQPRVQRLLAYLAIVPVARAGRLALPLGEAERMSRVAPTIKRGDNLACAKAWFRFRPISIWGSTRASALVEGPACAAVFETRAYSHHAGGG